MLNRRFGASRGSILAKLVLGVVVAAIMAGCLEAVLRAAWWLSGSHIEVVSTLQNRNDPSEKHFVLPASVAKQLGTSQRFGVESNVLTYPDRDLLFHVRPNPAKADVYCYEGIDRFGYRNRDALQTLRSRPRLGTTRVLLLGDSCAFGWGICRFDETLGFQLEKLIGAPTHRAQIINLAQPGYSTEQGLRLFRRWFPKVRPDFVILYFGWNDLFPTPGLTDAEVLRLLPLTQSAPMRALMGTALYRTLAFGLSRMVEPSVAPGTSHRSRVPLEQSGANMRAMVEESRAGGAGVYIVVPPRGPQFQSSRPSHLRVQSSGSRGDRRPRHVHPTVRDGSRRSRLGRLFPFGRLSPQRARSAPAGGGDRRRVAFAARTGCAGDGAGRQRHRRGHRVRRRAVEPAGGHTGHLA
jgi:lysophospholipase L1-like esterase